MTCDNFGKEDVLPSKHKVTESNLSASIFKKSWLDIWTLIYGAPLKEEVTSHFGLLDFLIFPLISRTTLHLTQDSFNPLIVRIITGIFAIPFALLNLPFLCLAIALTTFISPFVWAVNKAQSRNDSDSLWLPKELHTTVLSYLGSSECKSVENEHQDTNIIYQADAHNHNSLRLFTEHLGCAQLLEHVVRGEKDEAQAIIQHNPALAFKSVRDIVVDSSGRKITNQSPFQAALYMGNPWIVEIIKEQVNNSANNKNNLSKLMQEQYSEFFTKCAQEQCQKPFDFQSIINAIRKATPKQVKAALELKGAGFRRGDEKSFVPAAEEKADLDLDLVAELNGFREDMKNYCLNNRPSVALLLVENAFNIFIDNCSYGQQDKSLLFLYQIVGFIERFLPIIDLRAIIELGLIEKFSSISSFNPYSDLTSSSPLNIFSLDDLGFTFEASATRHEYFDTINLVVQKSIYKCLPHSSFLSLYELKLKNLKELMQNTPKDLDGSLANLTSQINQVTNWTSDPLNQGITL